VIEASISAKINGEKLNELPQDLYIPPEALEVYLETFEGPLDLLLYLIRKHNLDILDIPMAELTIQYMAYVEKMKAIKIQVASAYYQQISQIKPPEVSLDDLLEAWKNVLKRAQLNQHHKLGRAELSVREHMSLILRRLKDESMVEFSALFDFDHEGVPKLVVHFLAILELAKEGLVRITQQTAFSPIYLQANT